MEKKCGRITIVPSPADSIDINDLARFAVDEHNKKANAHLVFEKVVGAKEQVVAGKIYYITLEAKDGAHKNVYEAKVWVKLMKPKELLEFKLNGGAPAGRA